MHHRYCLFLMSLLMLACSKVRIQKYSKETKQIIQLDEGTNFSAASSSDGTRIVFDALGRLWVRNVDNLASEAITDPFGNARQPRVQPTGDLITFQGYWEGNWHVYTIHQSGTGLQKLTHGNFDHREPDWSPDGKSIIFSSDRSGNYDLWEIDLSTLQLKQRTSNIHNEFAPSYSPDHQEIIYVSDDPNVPGLRVLDTKSGISKNIYQTEDPLYAPTYSPDGKIILFNQIDSTGSRLMSVEKSGNVQPKTLNSMTDVFPFRVSWTSANSCIFTADGGLHLQQLGHSDSKKIPIQYQVQFKSKKYAYKSRNFDPEAGLPIKGLSQPQISPDGSSIVVVMLGDIWVLNRDGSKEQITNDPFVEICPTWSPDGKQLAYISDHTGTFALWTIDLESGKEEMIAQVVGSASGIDWSPTQSNIAISTTFGPRLGRISFYDLASKSISSSSPMITSSIGAPSWNSTGTQVAVSALTPYSSLYREGVNQILYFDSHGTQVGRMRGAENLSFGVRGNDGPIWSPDGKFIASISSGSLMLLPVDIEGQLTGKPQQLFDGLADNPSWTADARSIAFIDVDQLKIVDISSRQVHPFNTELTWERIAPKTKKIIHAGNLFDGKSKAVLQDVDIHIDGHRIVKIVPHQDGLQADVEHIDASDKFVMPGLIDGHAHQGSWEGRKLDLAWLSWGVTSTRDPATNPYDALNRREARESGHTIGPRIFYTGPPFDGNRIYYSGASALNSDQQITLELERADRLDYDMIKTYVRLSDPSQRQIIEKAHEIGVPVSSHELYPASVTGIDGIEHISGTSRRGYSAKLSGQNIAYSDVTTLIAKTNITFTPTTGIYIAFNYLLSQDDSPLMDPRVVTFVDPGSLKRIRGGIDQIKANAIKYQRQFKNSLKMVKDVHENGGFVTAGTDGPIIPFGFALHMELESYVHAGISNFEVLKTCTNNAAQLLHAATDLGTIEPGKLADILILNENPLEDIRHTRSMHAVMSNGEIHLLEDLLVMQNQTLR